MRLFVLKGVALVQQSRLVTVNNLSDSGILLQVVPLFCGLKWEVFLLWFLAPSRPLIFGLRELEYSTMSKIPTQA